MKKGYNELVGVQATFAYAADKYNVTMVYRWKKGASLEEYGTMRTYDMDMYAKPWYVCAKLRDAYAPAIQKVWRSKVPGGVVLKLPEIAMPAPAELYIDGEWKVWAEW